MAETICLTGKGMENNALVTRQEWERRIEAAGHYYTDKAQNCTVLVASRNDTTKAVNARARGARVEDYDWLIQLLSGGRGTGFIPPARVTPTKPVKPIDTSEMEGNALWGLF